MYITFVETAEEGRLQQDKQEQAKMSKTTEHQVRLKGEIVVSTYWLIPTDVDEEEEEQQQDPQKGYGNEGKEEMKYIMVDEDSETETKAEIIPTKPNNIWNPSQTAPKSAKSQISPWIKDAKQPIGAPIAGMPKRKDNKPGSSGDKWKEESRLQEKGKKPQTKAKGEGEPGQTSMKRGRDEEKWEWYPTGKPKTGGQQTGHKVPTKGKGKSWTKTKEIPQIQEVEEEEEDEEEEEEDEEEERYGHILKNGRRVPWDFLLDREIKLDATTPKPPPPKLCTVQNMAQPSGKKDGKGKAVKSHVIMTKEEIESIVNMMKKEDEEGRRQGRNAVKEILNKYGCRGG